jgi:rSAM/selenodomain-associated transferase 1
MESSSENTAHSPGKGCTLVVMAKAPRPGMVKTRLAQSLPVEAVTALYRCFLNDTIDLARSLGTVEVAIMCPAADVDELKRLAHIQGVLGVVAQKGEGLAAGLTSVFAHFAAPGRQRVVAFNSDSPHLPASILGSAFEALIGHDVVVGPTHDGGYYLVGAKTAHPALFDGDGMGTRTALEALLARARELQLSVGFTDPFYDIDVESDLTRLAAELRLAPARAPRTAVWLKQWGEAVSQLRTTMGNL